MMGSKTASAEEGDHIEVCKVGPCIPCLSAALAGCLPWTLVVFGGDYDHKKSGNIRRGHLYGFCSCIWHHRGHPMGGHSTVPATRAVYGPSLMDGSKLFRITYGSDDELIELQRRWLAGEVEWGG